MKRAEIEQLKLVGTGWDASLPGPIETIRFKRYDAPDGTGYAILDSQEKFSTGNALKGIPWTSWTDLDA
jgi:hypothetical protein